LNSDYCLRARRGTPTSQDCRVWEKAEIAAIDHFHERSGSHRPHTLCRALYDAEALHLRYDVDDRFVRSVHVDFQDPVCRDSCVECFIQPPGAAGYFNFEINAGGTLHVWYVIDPVRLADGNFRDARPLTSQEVNKIRIISSLPRVVDPEIADPIHWRLYVRIPFETMSAITGKDWSRNQQPAESVGTRVNFFKLGSATSHPHWASWSPIGSELNFHTPQYFGNLVFQ
jgi:hypothetical protein